jgi:AraC-like DNA-binding protein
MRHSPTLYEQILYDVELEEKALECLSRNDVGGCCVCLEALVDGLHLAGLEGDGDGRPVVQLLTDVLHKINQRRHQVSGEDRAYQDNRVELIERFAAGHLRPPHPLVGQAKSLIDADYDRRISLSVIAERLNVSSNYLSRLFRREVGITLTAYVHRVRLGHAVLLLAEGGSSISEIAYRVGYQNYRDFYRNFVKYEKRSPRQMRRDLHKKAVAARRPRSTPRRAAGLGKRPLNRESTG